MEWRQYPEHGAQVDSPLIPTIIKQLAQSHGDAAEFIGQASVRVYCTQHQWINLLMEVARRIYRDD